MPEYLDVPFVVDADDIAEDSYAYLQTQVAGWEPNEGQLDRIVVDSNSRVAADVMTQLSQIPISLFRYMGKLVGVFPEEATSAVTTTTWAMIDALGHTIPAGTTVSIRNADGTPVFFTTINDVLVPPGLTTTALGEVTIQAVDEGLSGSGLGAIGAVVSLDDPLDFVVDGGITQEAVTSGGQDAESDATYISRLVDYIRLLGKVLVVGRDYERAARQWPGVARAIAIDGYNPTDDTDGNVRTIGLSPVDTLGNALSAPAKTALLDYLEPYRQVNTNIYLFDPTYTNIDVTYEVNLMPGFASDVMEVAIDAAIGAYLDKSSWGSPDDRSVNPQTTSNWINTTTVSYYELVQAVSNVIGVDRILNLTIGANGGAQARNDIVMAGRVTLPNVGVLTRTTHTA